MKPRGDDLSSRSCSCTSCFYKTESEHPSVRGMLAKGSRIDKLFIGKYLPLREEKLLNRLVRTRAIYDDIRTQLLSDSNVSESDKGDLKPTKQMLLKREEKRKDIELSDAERSSVLLQLINLVDKGATLGPQHKLSECCSCCVCSPKPNKFSEIVRVQKHKHRHASSRSSFTSGMRTRDERQLATHGHRARYIRSDPYNCACPNEESDLNVTGSKAIIKKVRKPAQTKETVIERTVGERQKMKRYKSRQGMGEAFSRSMLKLKESKSQISAKLKSQLKKSKDIMKATEQGVKVKIKKHTKRYKHSEILYSLRGGNRRRKSKEELELEVKETIAKIKKDSLAKIREDMKKKKYIEKWACNFECNPEECEPKECYKIKMQQKMRRGDKIVQYKEKNIGDTTRVLSKTRISQYKIPAATAKTETNKQNINTVGLKENAELNKPQIKSEAIHVETENNQPKKKSHNESICECKTTKPTANISYGSIKSSTELPSTTTKTSASETIRQKRIKAKASNVIGRPKINVRGGYALKRCICSLKLKPKGNKAQRPRSFNLKSAQSKTLSRAGEYSSQQRKARGTTSNTKNLKHTKSTSSLMSKSSSGSQSVQSHSLQKVEKLEPSEQHVIKRKKYDEPTTNKQAVRISSNFSFNIEFYKDTPSTQQIVAVENKTQSKVAHSHKHHRKVRKHKDLVAHHRQSQITTSEKSNSTLTRHDLRRCFCTLKLAKKNVICECTSKTVTYSKGTLTSGQNFTDKPILRNIGTERRIQRRKYTKFQLLSYECEPGICVPNKCDPNQCLEVINKRNAKKTSRGSATFNRKARSTYSITERRGSRSKTKKVQSVFTTHEEGKSLVIPQRKVASSPSRQVVRIGSSFSFDIEFYKDKPRDTLQDNKIFKVQSSTVKLKTRASQQKYGRTHQKYNNITVQSTTKDKGIFVESAIKRCFCTLKLQKKAKSNAVRTTAATETVPVNDTIHPDMVTRSTKMKKKRYRQLGLLPYECEPGICVPGECDPYQCLEKIKLRGKKRKDFGTRTSQNVSTASTTSSSKSRHAIMQSNLRMTRKKRKRSKYTASSSYAKVPIPIITKSSRPAVYIESDFSFNVEFAKGRSQKVQLSDKPVMEEPVRNVRMKQKGENPNKKKLMHSESQSVSLKKINKGIKPIIKRCFCTLKLQNNKIINKPTETIAMPVQVLNESFSLRQNTNHAKNVARQKNIERNDIDKSFSKLSLSMTTKSNTMNWFIRKISTSSTEFPLNINKTLMREEQGSRSLGKISSKDINKTKELNKRRAQLIGVSPYLRKSFYALNLHVQNQQKKPHKLLPYECEPGVCVPGECNPYECLKLINKRLMKRSSTMTTSGNRSQSTSSDDTRLRSSQQQSGKTRQVRADKGRDRVSKTPKAIKYELPPTQTHKQAVRVGSTFSFDIEFFKNKSSPDSKDVVQEKRKKKDHEAGSDSKTVRRNHKSTRGSQILRRDKPSQTTIMTHDKGQNITRPKRCFCTLKLQKRGKQHVQVAHEAKPQLHYTNTGQNTKNRPYKLFDLDPNECEPGVCIPGECDPYECLERLKKRRRKDFGSGMRRSMMSSSIMTDQPKKPGKHVQIKEKSRKAKRSKSALSSISRPSVEMSAHPSRQAVRIGSSFSFNVEFFKERSHGQGAPITTSDTAPVKMKTGTKDYNQNTNTRRPPSSMERSSQDSTNLHHQNTQHGPNMRAIGTKTGAFLKRCFCTAKFFQKSPPNEVEVKGVPADVKATPSLMQRCLCTLKLLTAKSKPSHAPKLNTVVSNQTHQIKENKIKPLKLPKLEPHECEPGVCVPSQCDPYECLERINRRNRDNKITLTDTAGTRSTSTGFRSSKSAGSHMRTKDKRNSVRKQKYSQPVSMAVVKPVTEPPSMNQNVVRIGSNFSFNVEFYKSKISPTYQNVQRAAKEIKKKKRAESTASTKASQRGKDRGVNKYGQSHSRQSQADFIKKEDRATGMLKRCFCTLALHQEAGKDKKMQEIALVVKEQGTESPHYKTYPTVDNKDTITKKPYKLEPYECEPGVCTPGECDPYECLKRIQKRREQGTSTPRNRTNSLSTLTRQSRKLKDHHAQSFAKHKKVARPSQQRTRSSRPSRLLHYGDQGQRRQAVRIGSNFSFNIEFSKSRTGGDQAINIRKEPKVNRYETRSTSSKPEKRESIKTAKSQGRRKVRDSDSQVLVNKVHSTLTETTPFLKRCFCTLKFKSIDKKPHDTNKQSEAIKPISVPKHTEHRNMSISTRKEKPFKTLLPYECEPGVCVPGQCDPYECLKRIEKRNMQTKGAHTDRPRGRGVSTITAETRTSPKGLQNQIDIKPKGINAHNENIKPVKKQHITQKTAKDKQAVRVGSSFSFDVEFFKDKTNRIPFHTDSPNVYSTLVSTKNINPGFKKHKTATSGSVRKLMDRRSQSIAGKTAPTGSKVGPLLKRCFCTLKLQKVGRLQRPSRLRMSSKVIKKPISTHKTRKSSIPKYKDTGVETTKRFGDLLPYECEPNICVPGQCNLYECLDRIRIRKMCDSTKNCMNHNTKKISRLTGRRSQIRKTLQTLSNRADVQNSKDIRLKDRRRTVNLTETDNGDRQAVHIGSRKLQTLSNKADVQKSNDIRLKDRRRTVNLTKTDNGDRQAVHVGSRKFTTLSDRAGVQKSNDIRLKDRRRKVILTETDNVDRQAVHIGSNFSFNMEFYKEHKQHKENLKNVTFDALPKTDKQNTMGEKLSKTSRRETFDQGQRTNHKELQATLEQEHKATGCDKLRPLLQRCFCTLKLSEGNKQHKLSEPDVQVDHKVKPPLKYANTGQNTEKHHYKLSDLDPNECEPGVCIPGQCDPYECLQRIKKRNFRHMATGVSRNRRCSQTSLTSFGPISKSKRIQYSPKQKSQGVKISNIVEQPRFPFLEPKYYQGLKIGSNVSVNIEFFKEYALPTNRKETEKKTRESKNFHQVCDNQTCSKPDIYKEASLKTNTLTKSKKQQADGIKTENKASIVGNTLKRCFCTAKLADCKSIITVGRVDKLITNSPFQPRKLQIYQMHQDNAKSRNKQNGDFERTQNASTRINNKYFSEDPLSADQKNLKGNKNSDDMKTILPYAPKKFHKNESKTLVMRKRISNKNYCCTHCKGCNKEDVLPTKSAKRLTKKQEKILLTNQNGLKRFVCTCVNVFLKNINKSKQNKECTFKINNDYCTNSKVKSHPKTSKSERKYETKNQEKISSTNQNGLKRFVCGYISTIFNNKSGSQRNKKKSFNVDDDRNTNSEVKAHLKTSKSERKPNKKHVNKVKQSKSLNAKNAKVTTTSLFVCPICQANFNNGDFRKTVKLSRKSVKKADFDSKSMISEVKKAGGDVKTSHSAKSSEKKNKITPEEVKGKQTQNKNQLEERQKMQCADLPCCVCKDGKRLETINLDEKLYGLKLTKAPKILPKQEKEILQRREVKSQDQIGKSHGKEVKSQDKKAKSQGKAVKSQDEKGKSQGKEVKSQDKKDKSQGKEVKSQDKKDKSQNKTVNSQDKKGKTQSKAVKSQDKEGKTQSKAVKSQEKKGKPQRKAAKSQDRKGKTQGMKKTGKQRKKSEKPCVCGSSVCAKIVKKERMAKIAVIPQKPKKPCVCGSLVCAKEVKYMQGKKDTQNKKNKNAKEKKEIDEDSCYCNLVCGCKKYAVKEAERKKKLNKKKARKKMQQAKTNKQLEKRRKEYAKEDRILKMQRLKRDFEMYRQVQKTKDSGDCALLTESILDLAKLGCTTGKDVLRSTYRTIMDPKNTCRNIRTCVRDPKRGVDNIKRACADSGVGSTCKRVALRFKMMRRFKIIKQKLEACACTNYLIHMCDKDPRKRMKRKKKKKKKEGRRVPEPMDFECSAYMASLRKRPFLAVYYLCPWFYPHCLSMLNVWRQFTDILLFLLAVVVWSPCIMLMETCRAMMCCFMCTG